ncbi:hypothetical protein AUEXF2481DRAFT_593040 [Aureobasidium subglaciale EXF-2481]|uniref:Uncharacterized protein n=1 Tax=Aureobasidium subglaciale (strain EXF-2481) TaxID=1043005 RepID=A0A074YHQ2_AURSE|nr:uncharacterized protein AUEXF2481DRAFT_593040 [Aureobasidium subglaciale EXF-2481]KEQ97348.1 hypothetical protein AUEXF2481DRAFT_593040 [Aureobasidium subglaciale EXF-2481]
MEVALGLLILSSSNKGKSSTNNRNHGLQFGVRGRDSPRQAVATSRTATRTSTTTPTTTSTTSPTTTATRPQTMEATRTTNGPIPTAPSTMTTETTETTAALSTPTIPTTRTTLATAIFLQKSVIVLTEVPNLLASPIVPLHLHLPPPYPISQRSPQSTRPS